MKKLIVFFQLIASTALADYVIHAPAGIYVSVALKMSADQYSTSFSYGANSDETAVYDGWFSRPAGIWPGIFVADGNTIALTGDWLPGWDGTWQCPTCNVWVGGPPPDFMGGGESSIGIGAEYWIDFASDGTARIATTQPSDFGKWAWDGSINPSWIALKKGFAKGHNKQPLPTPK